MIPRFVPSLRIQRIVAWVAFWPVAFVSARASLLAAVLISGAFFPVVVPRRWASLAGAAAVVIAVSTIETSFLFRALGFGIALAAGLLFFWTMRRANASTEERLDAPVHALEPFALWTATAGVVVAHGAQAAHLHATFPNVARVVVIVAFVAAALSIVAWRSLRNAIGRVYRGVDRALRVQRTAEDVNAPLVTDASPIDAAVVEGASPSGGPYRAGEGRVVARVPSDATVLAHRHRMLALQAFGTTILCAAAGGLVVPPLESIAHPPDLATSPAKLPPLPGECRDARVKLRFVPVAPLRVLDVEEIAARYSATGIADAVVERPLAFQDRWLDPNRRQVIGEEILRDAHRQYAPRSDEDHRELMIVVTDRDMFLRDVEWRYAFATRDAGVAVVSLARMDPNFPLLAPMTYEPARAECTAPVRARAFRMITRQVLVGLCAATTVDDPRSARRRSVMGLSDLDAIDEARY